MYQQTTIVLHEYEMHLNLNYHSTKCTLEYTLDNFKFVLNETAREDTVQHRALFGLYYMYTIYIYRACTRPSQPLPTNIVFKIL